MNYQKIVDSLKKPEPRDYTPEFSVELEGNRWCVFDGEDAVMDLYLPDVHASGDRYSFDIFKFSPFEDAVICNHPAPDCPVVDMQTLKNSQITLPYFYSKDLIAGCDDHHACVRLNWECAEGEKLLAVIEGEFNEGQRIRYDFILDYDPAGHRYRFHFSVNCWKLAPMGFEPLNFLMAGALRGREELTRWTHSIYEDRFNVLRKIVHSNALFCVTDYSEPPYWRQKSSPLQGAWVAFGCNEECNPAFIVHKNNLPLRLDTCSALFDEHLIFFEATNENLDENYFHFNLETEFVNLDYDITKELFDNAKSQPMPKKWRIDKVALPFYIGPENDWEEPLDVAKPEVCPIFEVETEPDAPIQWVEGVAYKGNHSIKLQQKCLTAWTELTTQGSWTEVEPHTKYRLSAMIKCVGVDRFARIALSIVEYKRSNCLEVSYSNRVSGDSDWTYVEAVLDTDTAPYVMPTLQIYGKGEAYFDSLKLEKVNDYE